MSSPKIIQPVAVKATAAASSQGNTPLGTSPAIPNIPPRSSNNSAVPKSMSRSFKSPPAFGTSFQANRLGSREPTPKPSIDDLGRKASPATGAGAGGSSNLTAQFKSPGTNSNSARDYFDDISRGGSGFNTPNESGISNAIDVDATEEQKARVLGRHLVSKEERSASTKPLTPGDATPVGEHGDSGYFGGGSGGQPVEGASEAVEDETEETFPIPYDAPGGDVT